MNTVDRQKKTRVHAHVSTYNSICVCDDDLHITKYKFEPNHPNPEQILRKIKRNKTLVEDTLLHKQ